MPAAAPPFDPFAASEWRPARLILRWYWLALGGILSGVAALLVWQARPPQYEAAAVLSIGIDTSRTPPLDPLTEIRTLDRVAALIQSDQTLTSLAQAAGTGETLAELRARLRLDRRAGEWDLVAIADDPSAAAALANAWLDVSIVDLDQAMDHAWNALRVQKSPIVAECLELAHGAPVSFVWECFAAGPALSEEDVRLLREEIALSRGLLPIVSYAAVRSAAPPTAPVVWPRGPVVAGAVLAGMILAGLAAALLPLPVREAPAARLPRSGR